MDDFDPTNKPQIQVEFGIYLVMIFVATGIGFWLMGSQGIFLNNTLLLYWILYLVLNMVYVGFAAMFLFIKTLGGRVLVYLHNLDYSWLQNNGMFKISENTPLYTIFKSFWLSLLLWHIILLPLTLAQFVLPRETAILLLPVKPQTVFPLAALVASIFFTIFPASTGETGILAMFNSLVGTGIFKTLKNKVASAWVALVLLTLFSGGMWLVVHNTVSAGEEINQRSHYIFGAEQGFLMVITGSVAPAIALHNINLLFYGIQDVVGQYELLRYAIPITIVLLWLGTITLVISLNKKR
jgi:hypothetical protein